MRTITTLLLAAAVSSAFLETGTTLEARQNAPADRAAVEKALIANEQKVSDAIAKGDVKTVQSLITADGGSTSPEGFMPTSEFLKFVASGQLKLTDYKLSDFHFVWADPNNAILSYTWTGKGTAMGQPVPPMMYASTVWTKRGGTWLAVYHHEAVAMPPPKK
jgi:ketosteroid isomerase-like protein